MKEENIKNNRVSVTGTISSGFTYSHQVLGEKAEDELELIGFEKCL